jgi:hypothetical protein
VKKTRGGEPTGIILHIYIEISQGNSLHSYLKQEKISFIFLFSSTKSEKLKVEQALVVISGRGR